MVVKRLQLFRAAGQGAVWVPARNPARVERNPAALPGAMIKEI
jgi:hypothetical protein